MRIPRLGIAVVALASCVLAADCGPVHPAGPATTRVAGRKLLVIQDGAGGFGLGDGPPPPIWIGDAAYEAPVCGLQDFPMAEGTQLGPVIAAGVPGFPFDRGRSIQGVDPGLMVAVHWRDPCGGSPSWELAIGAPQPTGAREALANTRALCTVPIEPQARCGVSIPVTWSVDAPGHLQVQRTAYFPMYVAAVNHLLSTGRGPTWRFDPVATAMRDFEPSTWCKHIPVVCRGAANVLLQPNGDVLVRMVAQWGRDRQLMVRDFTVRRVAGGPAWWVVQAGSVDLGSDETTRSVRDLVYETCCERVVFDETG